MSSHKARQARTSPAARTGQPWESHEDDLLAKCDTDDELEALAVQLQRTFAAVEQRRKRPVSPGGVVRSGLGWPPRRAR